MVASIISFLAGAYIASTVLIFVLGSGDVRFKAKWAILWPFYLHKLFGYYD